MKKNLLFISLLLFAFSAHAQFSNGDVFLGGNLSLSNRGGKDETGEPQGDYQQVSIRPSVGYFLNEKTAAGFYVGYGNSRSKNRNSSYQVEYKSVDFGTGLFAQRYFALNDNFYFTLTGDLGFDRAKTTTTVEDKVTGTTDEDVVNSYSLSLSVSPGFTFFPSRRWAIDAGFGSVYYNYQRSLSNESRTNTVGLNYGSLGFGLRYFFRE